MFFISSHPRLSAVPFPSVFRFSFFVAFFLSQRLFFFWHLGYLTYVMHDIALITFEGSMQRKLNEMQNEDKPNSLFNGQSGHNGQVPHGDLIEAQISSLS